MRKTTLITTPKQKERQLSRALKKQTGRLYRESWHQKFVIHKVIEDYNANTKTSVWFETIERKGKLMDEHNLMGGYWYYTYRLPEEAE